MNSYFSLLRQMIDKKQEFKNCITSNKAKVKKTFLIDKKLDVQFSSLCELAKVDKIQSAENAIVNYKNCLIEKIKKGKGKLGKEAEIEYGKAIRKIPKWANSSNKKNHKLIASYFAAEEIQGEGRVTKTKMKELCAKDVNFGSTYSSLKSDGPTANGRVFEDDGTYVWIWDEVKPKLLEYKKYFSTLKKKVVLHKKGWHEDDE